MQLQGEGELLMHFIVIEKRKHIYFYEWFMHMLWETFYETLGASCVGYLNFNQLLLLIQLFLVFRILLDNNQLTSFLPGK